MGYHFTATDSLYLAGDARRQIIRAPFFHPGRPLRSGGLLAGFLALICMPWAMAAYVVDFEGDDETKNAYADGNVVLNGLEWRLTEALIGTLDNDKKNGARSLRMRRSGTTVGVAEMLEDKVGGIGSISFLYARYGNETDQPDLFVEYSTDAGIQWHAAGLSITNFPVTLTEWTVDLNLAGTARIRLRTDTGGSNERRMNIDDIVISDFCDGTPLVTTADIGGITPSTALPGGEVLDDRGSPVTTRGIVWNTLPAPTTDDHVVTSGTGTGAFTAKMIGLTAGREYNVRAFAENANGIAYGENRTFMAAGFTDAPVLHPVTNRHRGGFTAAWQPLAGADGYLLDIASDPRFHAGGAAPLFRETMGGVEGEVSITDHDGAGGFDHSGVYGYCSGGATAAAEVRATSSSSGYTDAEGNPASGGANIWFTMTEGERGFCIRGIDPRPFTGLRLSFGYRKESAQRNADFTVAWSDDSGENWHPLTVSGLPPPEEATGWYFIEDIELPAAAEAVESLSLRWKKTGGTAMRIDDIMLRGDGGDTTLHPRFTAYPVTGTSCRIHSIARGPWWIRIRATGDGGTVSLPSAPQEVNVTYGGTVTIFR